MSSGRRSLGSGGTSDLLGDGNPASNPNASEDDDDEYMPDLIETEDDDAGMMDEEEYEEEDEEDDEFYDLEDDDEEDSDGAQDIISRMLRERIQGAEQDEAQAGAATAAENRATGTIYLSREELLTLFNVQQVGSRSWLGYLQDEDQRSRRPQRSRMREPAPKEPVPNPEGQRLMFSGSFGNNERRASCISKDKRIARRLLERELGGYGYGREKVETPLMKQDMIPNSIADAVIAFDARCYCGQFSKDGSFFFNCSRDMTVRMYDTSNPYQWKPYKSISSPSGQWHITDASLSNDNTRLAFCSLSSTVTLASVDGNDDRPAISLDFSRQVSSNSRAWRGGDDYGYFYLFSVRFSGDGRELVGGAGDRALYVFDIERNATVLRIRGHDNDVNAVCFGDENSPHILYSGSDDATIKVWDRRSLAGGRPAGVFLGHTEGITYVDSKGDGMYVVSNCKDQTAKLWDIRKVHSAEKAEQVDTSAYSQLWDYRNGHYDSSSWTPHPYDCSLVTFRDHMVERTLIRCHFSPSGSTDGRYIYSGSRDGKVYIWNLDATLKATLDVAQSSAFLRGQRPDEGRMWDGSQRYDTIVRDVSWHPSAPVIAASAWNGWGNEEGACTIHTWKNGPDHDETAEEPQCFDSELSTHGSGNGRRRSARHRRH